MGISVGHLRVAIGDVVEGRYRIIGLLGAGGMGSVFLAEHELIKRRVAIKVLHPELATDPHVIDRFMNEARVAGTLGHPNIVVSTDMGFTREQIPYIVYEYLEGTLLADEIYRVGGLAVRRAVRIAKQIASAAHAVHRAGIIHRDLKCDNVFLTDDGDTHDHVKVLDFGISRFVDVKEESMRRGMVIGTPEFMAPEQITAPDRVDRRADIYALGVILFEMLCARRPFCGVEPLALLDRIVHDAPPPITRADVPRALADLIVNRLLAKSPDARLDSMVDVETALDAFDEPELAASSSASLGFSSGAVVAVGEPIVERADATDRIPLPAAAADPILRAVTVKLDAPARRAWLWYGVAAVGVAVGLVGVTAGMSGAGAAAVPIDRPLAAPIATPVAAIASPRAEPATLAVAPSRKITVELGANVTGARVTFRRRVTAAPTSLELATTDIVELVEVSAPGHRTARFWLTLDRPTRLRAQLVRGTGIVEATEEQTLVALGEVAPPPEPVAMPRVEPPRRVGANHAIDGAIEAPIDAVPAPIGPAPATDNALLDIRALAADDPEPATPEPPKQITAKSAPSEVPAPAISAATIAAVVGENRPGVLGCLADFRKAHPRTTGTLTLQLQVDARGGVARAQVQSTVPGASLVAACLAKAAYRWRFPARRDGAVAAIGYPFMIR